MNNFSPYSGWAQWGAPTAEPEHAKLPDTAEAGQIIIVPRFEDGKTVNYEIEIAEPMAMADVQRMIDEKFPTTKEYLVDRVKNDVNAVTRDEFEWLQQQGAMKETAAIEKPGFFSVMGSGLESLGKGAWQTAKSVSDVAGNTAYGWLFEDLDQENPSEKAVRANSLALIEGISKGTRDLAEIAIMAGEQVLGDDYDQYRSLKMFEKDQKEFKEGVGIFGEMSPEVAEKADNISYFLDVTTAVPMLKFASSASKFGAAATKATIKSAVKEGAEAALKEVASVPLTRKIGAKTMEATAALANLPLQAADKISSLAKGKLGIAATAVAANEAIQAISDKEDSLLSKGLAAGGVVAAASALGFGSRLLKGAAKVLGSEEAVGAILKQLPEELPKGALSRGALKVLNNVPHRAYNVARDVLDASVMGSLIGGGVGYVRAASDPFETGWGVAGETIKSALGAAPVAGAAIFVPSAFKELSAAGKNKTFVKSLLESMVGRPNDKEITVAGNTVKFANEVDNRAKFFTDEKIPVDERAKALALVEAAEKSGAEIVFVNDKTDLGGGMTGESMGAGVSMQTIEGQPFVFINADKAIGATTIAEEVAHGMISDAVARDHINNRVLELGDENKAIDSLMSDIGEEYVKATASVDPERAAKIQASIDFAKDINNPVEERFTAALEMSHEYLARGVAEKFKKIDPRVIKGEDVPAISKVFNEAVDTVKAAIESPDSGATFDPINKAFYKEGKEIKDPFVEKLANDIQGVLTTTDDFWMRYEDNPEYGKDYDRRRDKKTQPSGSKLREMEHENMFRQLSNIFGNVLADPLNNVEFGNFRKDTPIVQTTKATPEQAKQLFDIKSLADKFLISPKNREPVSRTIQAMNDNMLLNLTQWVKLKKKGGSPNYTQSSSIGIPLAIQQSSGGGPLLAFYDVKLLNDIVNVKRKELPIIDNALKDFRINTLEDWVPYIQEYFKNYSSDKAKPAAEAVFALAPKGASKESAVVIRDLLHTSGSVSPRAKYAETYGNLERGAEFKDIPGNIPLFKKGELVPAFEMTPKIEARTATGKATTADFMRDHNTIQMIRLDSITGAKLFAPNGTPIQFDFNKGNIYRNMRVNFSPGKGTTTENVSGSTIITDPNVNGKIIMTPGKKVKLFMGNDKPRLFDTQEEAMVWSTKKTSPQPKRIIQQSPGIPKELLKSNYFEGAAAKELNKSQRKIAMMDANAYKQLNPKTYAA